MGHRANFVVIRDGKGRAYYDQWAALGSTYAFAGGPAEAVAAAEQSTPTTELLDWAFAEAGYLLDYDEKSAIVFGQPEPIDPDEFGDVSAEAGDVMQGLDAALEAGPLAFLQAIAPLWSGWALHWDERGVDAFAAHLSRRGITSIQVQPPSHPENCETASVQG